MEFLFSEEREPVRRLTVTDDWVFKPPNIPCYAASPVNGAEFFYIRLGQCDYPLGQERCASSGCGFRDAAWTAATSSASAPREKIALPTKSTVPFEPKIGGWGNECQA